MDRWGRSPLGCPVISCRALSLTIVADDINAVVQQKPGPTHVRLTEPTAHEVAANIREDEVGAKAEEDERKTITYQKQYLITYVRRQRTWELPCLGGIKWCAFCILRALGFDKKTCS
ncbi:unnamed protein product [Malus baccata var. baccata]